MDRYKGKPTKAQRIDILRWKHGDTDTSKMAMEIVDKLDDLLYENPDDDRVLYLHNRVRKDIAKNMLYRKDAEGREHMYCPTCWTDLTKKFQHVYEQIMFCPICTQKFSYDITDLSNKED